MDRSQLVIHTHRGKQTLEAFALEREKDGELRYEPDASALPPVVNAPAGHVTFYGRDGTMVTTAHLPDDDVDVVILGKKFYVRRGEVFVEAKALRAVMGEDA